MIHPRSMLVLGMILICVLMRLLPYLLGMGHSYVFPWNVSPLTAMCLFGGAHFAERRWGLIVPLAALFISDLFIGFYSTMPFVYGSFCVTACLGFLLRKRRSAATAALAVGSTALLAECVFFLVTNFAVWAMGTTYPHDLPGLAECYVAAIPFFKNSLLGTALYSLMLFGGFALAQQRFSSLRQPAPETC